MKKAFGVALLGSLMLSGVAEAAFYRVDYTGYTAADSSVVGTYDGYFTYTTDGLDLDKANSTPATPGGVDDLPGSGLATTLLFNYHIPEISGSFDNANAGVGSLIFSDGTLVNWFLGGIESGIGGVVMAGPDQGILDMGLCANCTNFSGILSVPGYESFSLSFPSWQATEISAVPLPGAVWAFGAGLLGLIGLKRRRKARLNEAAIA